MDRDKLVEIINSVPNSSLTDVIGPEWEKEIVDRILAELSEEQKPTADEGLREFVVRIVDRAKYLGHSRVDLPVRILEKSLEMYPSHPVSEQKAQKEEQ